MQAVEIWAWCMECEIVNMQIISVRYSKYESVYWGLDECKSMECVYGAWSEWDGKHTNTFQAVRHYYAKSGLEVYRLYTVSPTYSPRFQRQIFRRYRF